MPSWGRWKKGPSTNEMVVTSDHKQSAWFDYRSQGRTVQPSGILERDLSRIIGQEPRLKHRIGCELFDVVFGNADISQTCWKAKISRQRGEIFRERARCKRWRRFAQRGIPENGRAGGTVRAMAW